MTKYQMFTCYSLALFDAATLRVLTVEIGPSRMSHVVYL
jgi:hypothetical protein